MQFSHNDKVRLLRSVVLGGILIAVVVLGSITAETSSAEQASKQPQHSPGSFVAAAYSTIQNNFWRDIKEQQLNNLFARGITRITETSNLNIQDTSDIRRIVNTHYEEMDGTEKRNFPVRVVDAVLKSLQPQGRSRVYTQKKEKQLANRVNNVNPERDLYDVLDISETADTETINQKYTKQKNRLAAQPQSTSTEQQMQKLRYAHRVLADTQNRNQYDTSGVEPTVFVDRLSDDVVHLRIHKYNKRTLQEFEQAVNSIDIQTSPPTSLILDLRSNVGGAVGTLPYLLGPFIGPDKEAYKFFQQGSTTPYRTKTGWMNALVPYKKVVILVDEKTQSTGELMASVLKKYNVGVVVGQRTRGWGSIERVFEIDEQYRDDRKYSLFMVHHLTLRGDGKPIQDNGVVPEVRMQDGWKQKLRAYIPHDPLINQVENVWSTTPLGTDVGQQ